MLLDRPPIDIDDLDRCVAAFEAPVGAGRLVVFGPEITFRGQTHGTLKLLFNALCVTPAKAER